MSQVRQHDLLPCPFCGSKLSLRVAAIGQRSDTAATLVHPEGDWSCPLAGFELADDFFAAWNRRAPAWVSVEERLPAPEVDVLIALHSSGRRVVGKWSLPSPLLGGGELPGGWSADSLALDEECRIRPPGEVTHWMPLPEPPA